MKLLYSPWAILNYDSVLTAFHGNQKSAKMEAAKCIDGMEFQREETAAINRWWKNNQRKYGLNVVRLTVEVSKLDTALIEEDRKRYAR